MARSLDRLVSEWIVGTGRTSAAVCLFTREGRVLTAHAGVTGHPSRAPVAPDSLFPIGSITKTFTAIAVLRAASEGLLRLDHPVTRYLEWFKIRRSRGPIRIEHLLSHSAGIMMMSDQSPDPRYAVWQLRGFDAEWRPGTEFWYSDIGYIVLGLILESVCARPLADIFGDWIFRPCRMDMSIGAVTEAAGARMTTGYRSAPDDRPRHPGYPLVPLPLIVNGGADSCIASTARDMARFGIMLLNEGAGIDARAIPQAAFHSMITPRFETPYRVGDGPVRYGLGMILGTLDGAPFFGHLGGVPSHHATLLCDAAAGIGIGLLSAVPAGPDLAIPLLRAWRMEHMKPGEPELEVNWDPPPVLDASGEVRKVMRSPEGKSIEARIAEHFLEIAYGAGETLRAERRSATDFVCSDPVRGRYVYRFDESGGLLTHGEEIYADATRDFPPACGRRTRDTRRFTGHFRSHNPWNADFRIVERIGTLLLIKPEGDEEELRPIATREFRLGVGRSPERLRFADLADGRFLRANLSGCDYFRHFMP